MPVGSSPVEFDRVKNLTGLSKEESLFVFTHLNSMRDESQALFVHQFRLRTSLSQIIIAELYRIEQTDVSRYSQQIREALMKDFVPKYIVTGSTPRVDLLERNTEIVKELFTQ